MTDVIDQTWVQAWTNGVPTTEEVMQVKAWLQTLPPSIQPMISKLPLRCLVKTKTWALDIPFMFSVGFVSEYHVDGFVTVCQSPGGPSAKVSPEDLSFVAPWKGLSREQVRSFLVLQPSP